MPFLVFTNLHISHNYYQNANAIFALVAVGMALASFVQGRDLWSPLYCWPQFLPASSCSFIHDTPASSRRTLPRMMLIRSLCKLRERSHLIKASSSSVRIGLQLCTIIANEKDFP